MPEEEGLVHTPAEGARCYLDMSLVIAFVRATCQKLCV